MPPNGVKLLTEVATDIKWLKAAIEGGNLTNTKHYEMISKEFSIINNRINKNYTQIQKNKYAIFAGFMVMSIIISVLLHLIGVY